MKLINFVAAATTFTLAGMSLAHAVEPSKVYASKTKGSFVATNTLDNDLETRWQTNGIGQYIQYKFDESTTLQGISIAFNKGDKRASKFQIQSTDNPWKTDAVWVSQPMMESSGETLELETFTFDSPVTAKFFRIVGYGTVSNAWGWESEYSSISEVDFIEHSDPLCNVTASVGLDESMEAAITLAESRYADLITKVESSRNKYISYTNTSGEWELESSSNWASGFFPGTLWYLYGLTGKESWKTAAESSTAGLESRATSTDNDTGFQIYGSYGIGRNMLGGTWSEADTIINTAASTLVEERYNTHVGAFRAWPQGEDDPYDVSEGDEFEVNVDMIMNMEVILSAAEKSGNTAQVDAAISHGDIAWDNLMRDDYGSYHVAGFNADGSMNYTRTHQGWHEDSTWSRGQSWAVYGYAMLYQYTQLPRMLERSENAYQYFKQATFSQGESWVAYADFDAVIDVRNPLDTSASAIVASAAISLYELTGNTQYLIDANDIINALIEGYLSEGTDFESILLSGSEQYVREDDDSTPDNDGYEVGSSFGDFYFIEALYRLKNANAPICE